MRTLGADPLALKRLCTCVALSASLFAAGLCEAQHPPSLREPADSTSQRPRIGLVLGGGGARGAAHIGVLKVLEESRIPIDCIVGTSMGALVGASYATGLTSAEIERLVGSIDWQATFGNAVTRAMQPMHLKRDAAYSNNLEFGLRGFRLLGQSGLVAAQQVESLLRAMVGDSRYQKSFDDLAIPFRAVATDIVTGELVLLDRGDLSIAMRASMAVPGAFSPVSLDGRVLVDGGIVRNLPVDVARELCADVIIAVSLASEPPENAELQSALAVLGQMVGVMIKNNERAQLATLGPGDVAISIDLPGMTSSQFDKVPQAIPLGERAARIEAGRLAPYGLTPDRYAQWRAGLERVAPASAQLAEVRIAELERVNPLAIRRVVKSRIDEPVDEARIADDAQRIFALNDFEKVDYRISRESPERATVEFLPVEKPWGPNYVRFDLGLTSSTGGDTGYILRLDHRRAWANSRGARWHNTLQVGTTAIIESSLFQPLDVDRDWFLGPRLRLMRDHEDLFRDGEHVARYKHTASDLWLDMGRELGTWGDIRIGVRRGRASFRAATGATLLPEVDGAHIGGATASFRIDTRDGTFAPTRGSYVRVEFFDSSESFGADAGYQRAEFFGQRVLQIRKDLIYLEAAGGSDLGSTLPAYDLFTLGGTGELAGFEREELRGREYAFGRVAYFRKITDLQTLLGQSLYAGVSVEAGRMSGRIDGTADGGPILGSSVFLGGRTMLGPALLILGFAEGGRTAAYLQIGRPLRER
jgi:NTE family protein